MTTSNPARTQTFFLGFHDPSGATGPLFGADDVADDDLGREIFGVCGVLKKVRMHVIETFSAHAEVVTVKWRPTPGSATGSVTLGVYTIPATQPAAGTYLEADLMAAAPAAAVSIGTGGVNQYGLSGSSRNEGRATPVFGPGGEFLLEDAGSGTAGQVNVYFVVDVLDKRSGTQTVANLATS